MNDKDVNLDRSPDADAEINTLRLNCIIQIITARPITVRLVEALLIQDSQPVRRKRRGRTLTEGKGGGA